MAGEEEEEEKKIVWIREVGEGEEKVEEWKEEKKKIKEKDVE